MPEPNKIQRIKLFSATSYPEFEERGIILAEILFIPLFETSVREGLVKRFSKNKVFTTLINFVELHYWAEIQLDLLNLFQKIKFVPASVQANYLEKEIESIENKTNEEYKIVKRIKETNPKNLNIISHFEDVIYNSIEYNTTDWNKLVYEYYNSAKDFKYRSNYEKLLESIINISFLRFIEILKLKLYELKQINSDYSGKENSQSKSSKEQTSFYDEVEIKDENQLTGKSKKTKNDLQKETEEENNNDDQYLRSIKDISDFIGCCDTTSQKIKNMNKEIFHQTGRKFIVKKTDLLNALKKRKKK